MFYRPHDRVQLNFDPEEGRTRQSEADACDVNRIMAKHGRDILNAHVQANLGDYGEYGDFSNATDLKSSLDNVLAAQDMFMTLPARIRSEFGNDPHEFLETANDPEKQDKLRELGLLPTAKQLDDAAKAASQAGGDPSGDQPADSEPSTGETPPQGGN